MAPSILVFSLFVVFLQHPSPSTATLTDACKEVIGNDPPMVEFCVTSLQTVPSAKTADTAGLALISVKLVITNTTSTKAKIKELLKSAGKKEREALTSCDKLYGDELFTSKKLIDALKRKNYFDANNFISAWDTSVSTCEDGFTEISAKSRIQKENEDLDKLSVVALAFIAKLQKG